MKYLLLVLLVVASANSAGAQTGSGHPVGNLPMLNTPPMEDGTSRALTLEEAIKTALDKNYTIRTTQGDMQVADMELDRSRDNLYPDLNLTAGYGYSYNFNPPTLFGVQSDASSQSVRYGAQSNFNIYSGGSDAARIRSSRLGLDAATYTLNWTKQQTVFSVVSNYINALRNRELVNSAQKSLDESKSQLDRVKGQNEAGSVPVGLVYQQEAVVGQNQLAVIQAKNNYENAKADLLYLLDIAPSDYRKFSVNLTGIDTTTSADHRQSVSASVSDEQITKVIESRPDIKSLIARLESQQASVDILSGSLLPRLDANAGLSGSGSNSNLSKIQPSNFFTGGLSLSFPLFNKWQTRLQIDEQNVNIESNRIRLNQAEQQLRSDVAKAANNLLFADESLDASDYALRSAEESLRLATERLNVGAGIQLDVIVAQSQVETARTNRVNAIFNYVLAQKQVQYTLGQWNY